MFVSADHRRTGTHAVRNSYARHEFHSVRGSSDASTRPPIAAPRFAADAFYSSSSSSSMPTMRTLYAFLAAGVVYLAVGLLATAERRAALDAFLDGKANLSS